MKSIFFGSAALCLCATALLGSAAHAEDSWEKLGSREVNFVADKDVVPVTANEGLFNAIKLDVEKGDLEMYDIVITFGNGEKYSPPTRFVFDQGTHSRTIDLPGAARVIRKIEFLYRSKLRKGRATMHVFGRHPMAPIPPMTAPPAAGRWDELGSREVSFIHDHDTIGVTAKEGAFTAIKVEVEKGNLIMNNIVVTFGDGEKFSPDTRWEFDQGSRSRTIDLPGKARFIKKVEFSYRSTLKKGKARLHLFGLHAE